MRAPRWLKAEWSTEPTSYDQKGCDGLYLKRKPKIIYRILIMEWTRTRLGTFFMYVALWLLGEKFSWIKDGLALQAHTGATPKYGGEAQGIDDMLKAAGFKVVDEEGNKI